MAFLLPRALLYRAQLRRDRRVDNLSAIRRALQFAWQCDPRHQDCPAQYNRGFRVIELARVGTIQSLSAQSLVIVLLPTYALRRG